MRPLRLETFVLLFINGVILRNPNYSFLVLNTEDKNGNSMLRHTTLQYNTINYNLMLKSFASFS